MGGSSTYGIEQTDDQQKDGSLMFKTAKNYLEPLIKKNKKEFNELLKLQIKKFLK